MTTTTKRTPANLSKSRYWITLLIIFGVAFCIRLWFLGRILPDPVFRSPVIDPKDFNFWAFQIMHNQWTWHSLQNHTPLYAYFLAVVYKFFGFQVIAVAVVQSVLGALSACLMYVLVRQMANSVAAAVCAVLMAGYWWFIYTQLYLFSESLAMFLNIALVCHLTFAPDSRRKFFIGGVLLGLSVLCRPDVLLFALLMGWWIFRREPDRRRSRAFYGIFLLGLALVVSPVLFRNHQISGAWLLRTQIGANFYIGNTPGFLGTNVFLEQGRSWQKFITMPYTEMRPGRELRETEINSYYVRKALSYIKEHPFRWLSFMFQKAFTILTGREFIRSEDVYFRDLFVRGTPFGWIATPILFVLAWTGLWLAWGERERWSLLGVFLLSLGPALFFPAKTRYLVPVMPFIMVFASWTVAYWYQAIRERDQARRLRIYVFILCACLVAIWNPLRLREADAAETYYAFASNMQYQGNYGMADKYFRAAVSVNPLNCSAWVDWGLLHMWNGDYKQALACFGHAQDIDPVYAEYYQIVRDMLARGQSVALPDFFLGLQDQGNPVIRHYMEYFHYP